MAGKEQKAGKKSYIKFLMWMALGGVIGGMCGAGFVFFEEGVEAGFEILLICGSVRI